MELQTYKMILLDFKQVKYRTGATGGSLLMLPLLNSDRTVHLPPPDWCLSLLRASTGGLNHQVKDTDATDALKENFASGIYVHSSHYTYQKSNR